MRQLHIPLRQRLFVAHGAEDHLQGQYAVRRGASRPDARLLHAPLAFRFTDQRSGRVQRLLGQRQIQPGLGGITLKRGADGFGFCQHASRLRLKGLRFTFPLL